MTSPQKESSGRRTARRTKVAEVPKALPEAHDEPDYVLDNADSVTLLHSDMLNGRDRSDDIDDSEVPIIDYCTQKERPECVAVTPDMLEPRGVRNEMYKFQKVFQDGGYMSVGLLVIPTRAEKPNRNCRESSMAFYVIEGKIKSTIHRTSFVLSTGGMFYVPRGKQLCANML